MTKMVALLRAVNVGGRKLPMAELRALLGELGWRDVATYIQSGNIVFSADEEPEALEAALEALIEKNFGYKAPAIIRTQDQWARYLAANPFPIAASDEPHRLVMLLSKAPPVETAEATIQTRAMQGERAKRAGDAIWIHYPAGQADTKLSPTVIDRAIGSTATGRNYRSVVALLDMLKA